jgi:hypothetical protein
VPVITQEQLGHASIAAMLNFHADAIDASHRKAIEAVERELFVVRDPVDYRQRQGWTMLRAHLTL